MVAPHLGRSRGLTSRYGMSLKLVATCPVVELSNSVTTEVYIYEPQTTVPTTAPTTTSMYASLNRASNKLDPPDDDGGINGEMTSGAMQKVIQLLVDECNMGTNSHFVDLGGGQGRPSFHCATTVDVQTVTSIEIALTRQGRELYIAHPRQHPV